MKQTQCPSPLCAAEIDVRHSFSRNKSTESFLQKQKLHLFGDEFYSENGINFPVKKS